MRIHIRAAMTIFAVRNPECVAMEYVLHSSEVLHCIFTPQGRIEGGFPSDGNISYSKQ